MRIIRVFPRKTKATPDDSLAIVGCGPVADDEADEVHISVAFDWDLREAERLARLWRPVAPTLTGGPATGEPGGDFVPGRYLKPGYVITSRGCPNSCWFCTVPAREGAAVRELPVTDGYNILDDNLLACSEAHIRAVFAMLAKQKARCQFTGGLEAARLRPWMAHELRRLRPKQIFFAYDTPDDLEPLMAAGKMMLDAGFTRESHSLRCYVLCGYPKDTPQEANGRMRQALRAGFTPMAMLYNRHDWRAFQRLWARPAIIHARANDGGHGLKNIS